MQVFEHKSFRFMYFVWFSALFCWLLRGLFGFEGEVGHGADEIVQAEITLGRVGVLIYRSLRSGYVPRVDGN